MKEQGWCIVSARGPEIGETFGRLTVLYLARRDNHHVYWYVRCACGIEKEARGSALLDGSIVSCGCKRAPHKRMGLTGLRQIYFSVRGAARSRSLDWHLNWEQFQEIISQPCVYCGAPPSTREIASYDGGKPRRGTTRKKHLHSVVSNGIDRSDNNLGYVTGNVVPCCAWCNVMKQDRTTDEFLQHVSRIYQHRINHEESI